MPSALSSSQAPITRTCEPTIKECNDVSHAITIPLRHRCRFTSKLETNGWCNLAALYDHINEYIEQPYEWNKFIQIIKKISNPSNLREKVRYEFDEKNLKIRAIQGHSNGVNMESEYVNIDNENILLIHGTYLENLSRIQDEGLKSMGRHHIHFNEVGSSKMNKYILGKTLYLYTTTGELLRNNMKVMRAANGVILVKPNETNNIPYNLLWQLGTKPWNL